LTTLHTFTGSDGAIPIAGLITDGSGALYGTTASGGTGNSGVVFKLEPPPSTGGTWLGSVLYNFTGGNDGAAPGGSLLADASGALYGTTGGGGTGASTGLAGTVFKLTPPTAGGTWTETVLWNFTGAVDGGLPALGLIDASGALYGVTGAGGPPEVTATGPCLS
jgi:uncharacterized repeat protein (TIGR03803 family)